MKFEEHCKESERLFGKRWDEVHLWLDEFAGKPGFGMHHRYVRHHQAGINEVAHLLGKDAAAVARQHIISDLKIEGWKDTDHFPVNSEDYRKMGLY